MKTRNIIILALTALFTVSCHTWDAPGEDSGLDSYGNPSLKETNVRTIAEVKEMFDNEINTNDLKKVEQSMQLKVVVVGNDEGGNIYKSLYIQDNTGALAVSIDQSGLFGAFATGQCVLIELKDLYVGGYEKQPQVGTLYFNENKGVDQVGRLTRYEWQRHYKLLNPVEGLSAKPIVTDKMSKLNLKRDCGRLVTLVGVRLKDADGEKVFAPSDGSVTLYGGCANREITGMSDVVVRTSTYAKFANMPMPTEKLTITGVASRYRDGWQLMPRKLDDIQAYTGNEVLDDIDDPTAVPASGSGTAADPFNIAAAIAKCQEVGEAGTTEKFYIKGIAVTEGVADSQYGNATFKMADTAEGSALFTAFQVYGSDGKKLNSGYKVNVGDKVVVYGPVVNYKGNTPETTGKGTAIIVSVNGKKTDGTDAGTPTPTEEAKGSGTEADPYNAVAANAYISTLAADTESDKDIFIKGKIVKYANNGEFNTQYGNASFYISDDGTENSEQFYVFRTLYLGNVKYTEGETPKVGDEVVICGRVVNYRGNTPETAANKSYIFSLNDSGSGSGNGGGETANTGTLDNPLTPSQIYDAVAAMESGVTSEADYYVKGKICSITYEYSAQYGTATFKISNDGNTGTKEFTVYSTYYHANGQKWAEGDTQIKVGDEVVVCGKVVNYNGNTPEFASKKSYVVTINGE